MKNIINISDLNRSDILEILKHIDDIDIKKNKPLTGKTIGLIFEKYSTRTRLSFHTGIFQLGGYPLEIDLKTLNLQRSESFENTFQMFDQYLDLLIYRTNDHEKLLIAKKNFNKPIINALSDVSHPCQILSDFYTIRKNFPIKKNLLISWLGDMNNVLYSYYELLNIFPELKLNVFTDKNIYEDKKKIFPKLENINIFHDLDYDQIKKSDCIMTDVYTSMNDKDSEKEKSLIKFQVNEEIMSHTNKNCIFMHCLPAKVNSEVTEKVLNSEKSIVLEQAKNRLVAQKGILSWLI
jgi:ornithine carbamoyltransferase